MKKINYLLTGILATSLFVASCSTQPKYTAFGGGWGTEKTTTFQNAQKSTGSATIKNNTKSNVEITVSDLPENIEAESITNSNIQIAEKLNPVKSVNRNQIKNETENTKISIKKPSTWKISNLFSSKKKTNSGGGGDTAAWGIASLACSFVGLFFLGILMGILGVIFGAIGLNKALKGLAIAGMVLGVIEIILFFVALAILI